MASRASRAAKASVSLRLDNFAKHCSDLLRDEGFTRLASIDCKRHSPLSWRVAEWFHAATNAPKDSELEIPQGTGQDAVEAIHDCISERE